MGFLFVLCLVCCAVSVPLSGAPFDERMCCLDAMSLLPLVGVSAAEFEVLQCETWSLTVLMGKLYPFSFGFSSQLQLRRRTDGTTLSAELFDDTVVSKLMRDGQERNTAANVCSFNVWHYTSPYRSRLLKIAELLKRNECDVILLQEMRMQWSFYGSSFLISDLTRLMPEYSFQFRPGKKAKNCGLCFCLFFKEKKKCSHGLFVITLV